MSKIITISIDTESLSKLDELTKLEFSDRSKLFRKWIYEHYKEKVKSND